jgi:hypothetical protein
MFEMEVKTPRTAFLSLTDMGTKSELWLENPDRGLVGKLYVSEADAPLLPFQRIHDSPLKILSKASAGLVVA